MEQLETCSPKYPEHEKLRAVQEKSQAIGEFLDWLANGEADEDNKPVCLAYYPTVKQAYRANNRKQTLHERLEDSHHNGEWVDLDESEWFESCNLSRYHKTTEQLLAKFFDIDLNKLEKEKVQMLDELREMNNAST